MSQIETFQEEHPSLESYWRSIILFGRNVASYKFALAKSLLEIAPTEKNVITLEELADPFSKHICEHLKHAPKQATSRSSTFLNACQSFNNNEITHDQLLNTTVNLGFNNVIDAFHNVNGDTLPIKFYEKDYSNQKKIILTDDIFKLKEKIFFGNFENEVEARWNLVETAWELNISRNLIRIDYDDAEKRLIVDDAYRRRDVTSARDALNGYQKGHCFYCYDDISVNTFSEHLCDVDHFFPHTLQPYIPQINLDGVWNLVLACKECNRGQNGKFAKVPDVKYLERLYKRNEFLIVSHHPLRETLIQQTGKTPEDRKHFLEFVNHIASNYLIHTWKTQAVQEATF